MKTKNKIVAFLEIAIVLCSVFLVALPVIAAEQNQTTQKVSANTITTASEDDYVLAIYGNANEDNTIDMRDLTYVKLIFFGKKPETELADAKYDGKINPLDFIQIKLIIVGKEKELTVVDSADRIVTVKKPIKRIIVLHAPSAESIEVLKAPDKVVGVGPQIIQRGREFPEFSKLPSVGGSFGSPDYEAILNLNPDMVIGMSWGGTLIGEEYAKHLPNVAVIGLDLVWVWRMSDELTRLGYILDRKDEAEEFIDWYEGHLNTIKDRTDGIPEDERPQMLYTYGCKKGSSSFTTRTTLEEVDIAGGRNIADNIPKGWGGWWGITGWWPVVDSEWVIDQNPDFIFSRFSTSGGYISDDPSGMKDLCDCFKNRPEFANLNAVKNGRVYAIHYNIVTGPGTFISVLYYAKLFHPDLFGDLDPKAIHQEYIDQFKRIDFDLDKHGVFVYPPLED